MKRSNSIVRVLSLIVLVLIIAGSTSSCSKDDGTDSVPEPTPTPTPQPDPTPTFNGPTYADNYISISSWSNNSKWNLANVHDPSVEKCGEYYYMYQTDASYGNVHEGHGHFPYRRSKDLVNWEYMGSAMATVPAWVKDSLNNKRARMTPALPAIENPKYGFWAPYIKKVGNKYRMYYSIVVDEPIVGTDFTYSWSERAFIGLAESDDLATNVWVDKGMVVCSEPDGLKPYSFTGSRNWEDAYFKFNAIDPTLMITPEGEHYLIYGSWHSGIASLKLNPTTGKPDQLKTLSDYGTRIASRHPSSRWQASEGPEIIYNPDTQYYYLFLAYDGLDVPYNTRVCRSKSITGPFVGINGANVTNGAECWPMITHPYGFNNHTGWVGFSHCSVFQNPDTKQWFYVSQARLPKDVPGVNASNALFMGHVRAIKWTEDGWPVVDPERYAAVPETTLSEATFIGTWEQITLNYQYGIIQKSATIYLTADKKVSGGVTGVWAYDSTTKTLTVNGIKCKVYDAWDWESATRKVTITYSGLTTAGVPVWGKKIN